MVEEDGAGRPGNGRRKVRIGKDNIGRLATQFQGDFFKVMGRRFHNELAHFRGAGEGNLGDAGVGGKGSGKFQGIIWPTTPIGSRRV